VEHQETIRLLCRILDCSKPTNAMHAKSSPCLKQEHGNARPNDKQVDKKTPVLLPTCKNVHIEPFDTSEILKVPKTELL
jgi:hypothetical protein